RCFKIAKVAIGFYGVLGEWVKGCEFTASFCCRVGFMGFGGKDLREMYSISKLGAGFGDDDDGDVSKGGESEGGNVIKVDGGGGGLGLICDDDISKEGEVDVCKKIDGGDADVSKGELANRFDMKDLGLLCYFLDKMVEDISIDANVKYTPTDGHLPDPSLYRTVVKSLIYLLVHVWIFLMQFILLSISTRGWFINDLALGFTRLPFNKTYYINHKPYNLPLEERYSFINEFHKLWVFSKDEPLSHGSPTNPCSELFINGYKYSTIVWQFKAHVFVPHGTTGNDGVPPDPLLVLARAIAGCSNHNSVGETAVRETLEHVMADALSKSGSTRLAVRVVCLAVSGVNDPTDQERILSWLRAIFPDDVKCFIHNDVVAAMASGTIGNLHGYVLIAGTGTIAYGYTKDGREARASGAGPVLGYWGSIFDRLFQQISVYKESMIVLPNIEYSDYATISLFTSDYANTHMHMYTGRRSPGSSLFTFGLSRSCLKSSRGLIIINGSPTEEFQFFKGLKQGDPLSPFFFILVMESLHLSFQRVEEAEMFKGIKIGQTVGGSMSRLHEWDEVVERVKMRLSKWKMKSLSIGGVLRTLESIRSHFFNSHALGSNKASWVSWKKVLSSKDKG
nr:N-acetyl-D-glucosamine kinase-like [Tanacetum cinerariifolium]